MNKCHNATDEDMKTRFPHRLRTGAVIAVGFGVLALCFGVLGAGCGDGETTKTDAVPGGSTMTSVMTERPPIDLLAPTDFQTASFALG